MLVLLFFFTMVWTLPMGTYLQTCQGEPCQFVAPCQQWWDKVQNNNTVGPASGEGLEDIQWTQREAGKGIGGVGDSDSTGGVRLTEYGSGTTARTERDGQQTEELQTYYQTCDTYQKAQGEIIKAYNLVLKVSWPETSRQEEWKVVAYAQTLGERDEFIKGHVPVAMYAWDLDQYSTQHIHNFLDIKLANGEVFITQSLHLIVMNHLWTIYDLEKQQFWDVFW